MVTNNYSAIILKTTAYQLLLSYCIEPTIGEGIVIMLRCLGRLLPDLPEFTVDKLKMPGQVRDEHRREEAILKPEPMRFRKPYRGGKSAIPYRRRDFSIYCLIIVIRRYIEIIVLESTILHQHILVTDFRIIIQAVRLKSNASARLRPLHLVSTAILEVAIPDYDIPGANSQTVSACANEFHIIH